MSDTSGLSDTNCVDNSDQDEAKERDLDPNYVEERFRVDRRKLERMIQATSSPQLSDYDEEDSELPDRTAEDFFVRVMDDTNTKITWPSKLKIGAKSKKDPHIKVAGHRDDVAAAKTKIMAVLDTKSSRVTLKMDVSHTEHSHVIGKGGNNIKRVMQETGCHIHFPDSNRNVQAEKSNQVSIAGQPRGVEEAQAKIRELLPLVFMFELPIAGLLQPMTDATSPQIQQIQNTYGVTISFKQRTRMYATTTAVIRGSVCNAKSVKEATVVLIEHLTGNVGNTMPVSMQLEIAPQHHHFIIGRSGANIKQIMQHTGATIHFPDPSTTTQRKGTVYITGAVECVFMARQQLIGCLPLVLMFDMKEDTPVDQTRISHLMEKLDVYISIKPKPKQPSKSVIVKSIERNTRNLYAARKWLLGLIGDRELLSAAANNSNSLAGVHVSSSSNVVVDRPRLVTGAVYRPLMVLAPPQPPPPTGFPIAAAQYSVYSPNGFMFKDVKLVKKDHNTNEPPPRAVPVPKPAEVVATSSISALSTPASSLNSHPPPMVPAAPQQTDPPPQRLRSASMNQYQHHHHDRLYPQANGIKELPKEPSVQLDFEDNVFEMPSTDRSVPSPDTNNQFELLSKAMSQSLLETTEQFGPIRNLPFSKSELQDAVSALQSKPEILESLGLPPKPAQISPESSGSQSRLRDIFSSEPSTFGTFPSAGYSSNFSNNNSSTSSSGPSSKNNTPPQPRRIKTPPGFSGHTKDNSSPLRELASRFDASQDSLFQNNHMSQTPGLGSQRHLSYDTRLGSLGSPLGGSPLRGSDAPSLLYNRGLFQNGVDTPRSSESGDSDSGGAVTDSRAPGSNRPSRITTPPLFSPPGVVSVFEAFDYEQKKLMATKAMQKKPEGESRIPTDYWSGMGFSKSMPDSMIREKLKANNVRYQGPSMTTTYETAGDEEGADPWRSSDTISEEPEEEGGLLDSPTPQAWPGRPDDLAELFSKLGLGKYTDLFTQQEIDLSTFMTLTDQDLKELGISTFGARRKMLIAIGDLNKRQTLLPPPPNSAAAVAASMTTTTTTTHQFGGNHSNHGNRYNPAAGLQHFGARRQDIASQSGRW